jgi:hypothetical protein
VRQELRGDVRRRSRLHPPLRVLARVRLAFSLRPALSSS